MKYETLIMEFVKSFPELKERSDSEFERWQGDEPPVHVFFGYVLNPFLLEQLTALDNPKLLHRIFEFLELMAESNDENVRDVLIATVLERLGDDKKILESAKIFMKSKTREMSDKVEKFWEPQKHT